MFTYLPIPISLLDEGDKDLLYTYCLLACYINHVEFNKVYTKPENLELICGDFGKMNRRMYFKKELAKLEERGYVVSFESKYYIANKDKFFNFEDEHYCLLEDSIVLRLSKMDMLNKTFLFQLYLEIIRSFNYKWLVEDRHSVISSMPQTFFAEKLGVAQITIGKAFKQLSDLKMIYIVHRGYDRKNERNYSNVYCRYSNKDMVLRYMDEKYGVNASLTSKANDRRKIAMKYMHFLKNPDKYSKDDILQLIDECKAYNDEIAEIQKKYSKYKADEDRLKDVSVLEAYLEKKEK